MARCEHERVRSTCSICKPELAYAACERKAELRGLKFRLTLAEFEQLTSDSCGYCGDYPALGIDRMDNRIGYLPTNSISCCWPCNRLKGTMSHHEFLARVKRIQTNQDRKRNQKITPVVPAHGIESVGEVTVVGKEN